MGPSWGHAGLSFVEVLITLASKDSSTMFAGHVACAAFADDAGKTRESLGSQDLVLCACSTTTRRAFGRSCTGGRRRRTHVRTVPISTDHAPAQATCSAQCCQDSFLSDSGILPAERRESRFGAPATIACIHLVGSSVFTRSESPGLLGIRSPSFILLIGPPKSYIPKSMW